MWIQNWFKSQCYGNWEHSNRIIIESIDNPGWSVKIDVSDTVIASLNIEYNLQEIDENNWYGISVKNSLFYGIGDPDKLEFILQKFRVLIEENERTEQL